MPNPCLARYHIINYNPIKKKNQITTSLVQDLEHESRSKLSSHPTLSNKLCYRTRENCHMGMHKTEREKERERDEPWIVGLLRGRSTGNFSDDRSNKKAAALFFKVLLLFLLLFFLEPPDLNPAQFSGRETHAPISLFRLLNTPSPEIEIQDKYCVLFFSLCVFRNRLF